MTEQMGSDDLPKALDHTAARVPPDDCGRSTTCPDCDVRGLVNHLVAGSGSPSSDVIRR